MEALVEETGTDGYVPGRRIHWILRAGIVSVSSVCALVALAAGAYWSESGDLSTVDDAIFLTAASGLTGLVVCAGLGCLGALCLVSMAVRKGRGRRAPLLITAATLTAPLPLFVGILVMTSGFSNRSREVRTAAFEALAERSQPLLDAIAAYERDLGHPPTSLADLVPGYLDSVPGTGMERYPDYDYLPPDGETRWELQVPCSLGMINFDVFFYRPSEEYPDSIYGGGVERIGRWAYVHEGYSASPRPAARRRGPNGPRGSIGRGPWGKLVDRRR